jgi:octaprenyl-diphosphate synthase
MVQIGDIKILKELANATNDISKGELIQLDALQNTSITLSKLENISYYKTGRLFEAAAKSGAMLANKDKKYESNISKCAKNLGILFQIKDDLLDYSLDEKVIGKPVFQDLKEGKITYPFYFAYRNANKKQKNQLQTMLGKKKQNIKSAYNMIKDLNGFEETEILASKYFDKAIKHANLIKNKHINQEVLKLVNSALYREK